MPSVYIPTWNISYTVKHDYNEPGVLIICYEFYRNCFVFLNFEFLKILRQSLFTHQNHNKCDFCYFRSIKCNNFIYSFTIY